MTWMDYVLGAAVVLLVLATYAEQAYLDSDDSDDDWEDIDAGD